jgi:putative transposase
LAFSSCTKGVNASYNRTGNLFQQKTKVKCLYDDKGVYPLTAFLYIHQNPLAASLVNKPDEWLISSFHEYAGSTDHVYCNLKLAEELLEVTQTNFAKMIIENPVQNEEGIF